MTSWGGRGSCGKEVESPSITLELTGDLDDTGDSARKAFERASQSASRDNVACGKRPRCLILCGFEVCHGPRRASRKRHVNQNAASAEGVCDVAVGKARVASQGLQGPLARPTLVCSNHSRRGSSEVWFDRRYLLSTQASCGIADARNVLFGQELSAITIIAGFKSMPTDSRPSSAATVVVVPIPRIEYPRVFGPLLENTKEGE